MKIEPSSVNFSVDAVGERSSMVDMPGSVRVVRFSGHPSTFVMSRGVCSNPECDCRTIVVGFTELGEDDKEKRRPVFFDVYLDIGTFREIQTERRAPEIQKLVSEYFAQLDPATRLQLRDEYDDSRAMICNAAAFQRTPEEVLSKSLIRAADVFCGSGRSERRRLKKPFLFTFEQEGVWYVVNDYYCINPRCECTNAVLDVLRLDEQADGQCKSSNLFSAQLEFNGRFRISATHGCTEEHATRLFESWASDDFPEMDIMRWRYARMKETGARLLGEWVVDDPMERPTTVQAPRSTSPNQPCPCGSGKKHKKCCGRYG